MAAPVITRTDTSLTVDHLTAMECRLLTAVETGDPEQRHALLNRYRTPGMLTRCAERLAARGILERSATGPGYRLRLRIDLDALRE